MKLLPVVAVLGVGLGLVPAVVAKVRAARAAKDGDADEPTEEGGGDKASR